MPAVNPNNSNQGGLQRTTFRPPWVKEGPTPLPMPTAPWTARGREGTAAAVVAPDQPNKAEKSAPRRLSKVTIVPSQPQAEGNSQEVISQANLKWNPKAQDKKPAPLTPLPKIQSSAVKKEDPSTVDQFTAKRPSAFIETKEGAGQPATSGLKETKRRESTTIPVVIESKRRQSTDKPVPVTVESPSLKEPQKEPPVAAREFAKPAPKRVDKASIPSAPKPPPPPMAPPPPPPPPASKGAPLIKSDITPQKAAKLEALRSRPRRRPDWTDMMKEVESGRQLRHVHCNDRSAPILPKGEKAKGQFVYESEKDAKHDPHKQLLTQIQSGVKLKKVKCNDRSRPNLNGLRKFRRQMTIEEQIQKSMSMADVVAVAAEPDELDDIDKVRDDLQSTKQMLAQELRNKEALERENKRLMSRLLNLEVELEKEKNARKIDSEKGTMGRSAADEKLVQQLKVEAAEANCVAKEMEDKYRGTAEELDATRAKLESAWLRNQQLEQELKSGARANVPLTRPPSSKKLAASMATMPNGKSALESDESDYTEETETETESEAESNEADAAAAQERRIAREIKLLTTKLKSYKDKQVIALNERHNLREQLRKQQKQLRQEKKKYKALQKEVDKMGKLMKDDDEAEDEEEEERPEEEEEEEEEEDTESESEESEEDDPTDGDLPEDAPVDAKRKNLTDRSKHHENRLSTLKKGNYLLKANIDRLQDDINRQREMSLTLQEDLNSVLAELG